VVTVQHAPSMVQARYDAIVVGSGLGGSSLAYKLTAHRQRVLVVEQGEYLASQRATESDPIGRFLYHVVNHDEPLFFVGGATKFYGAALYRMRESDFRETRHEAGCSPGWPFSYSVLEPYYEEGERLFRVHGSSVGDPSEPRRSCAYPYPPLPHDPIVASVVDRLKESGTPVAHIPRGLDQGPGGTCRMCGTCDGFFCQIDAKMDAEVAALRPALTTGFVDLITGAECLRVLTTDDGTRVTGIVIRKGGHEHIVCGDVVALGCGIPGSAVLLRRSRNAAHPEGLGNAHGVLGRFMGGHHAGAIFPIVSWKPIGSRHTKTMSINCFYEASDEWPYPMGVIQAAGQMPIWEGASKLRRPIIKAVASRSLVCFYMTEAVPTREAGLVFSGDSLASRIMPPHNSKTFARLGKKAVAAFRKAGYLVIKRRGMDFWHEVGTARMGQHPENSVVDPNGMVHGIEGLYVVDASVLPSAGAVNTGLTIIAVALRTGDVILGKASSIAHSSGRTATEETADSPRHHFGIS
jgi:choline dehydrogenase-like flavoprotein